MHKILQGLAYFHGTCGYQFELWYDDTEKRRKKECFSVGLRRS
jgi:hypothetical protein